MDKQMSRAAFWRAHVSGWRRSGQTQAAYCAAQGLSVSTLGYWISRLRKEAVATDDGKLTLVAAKPTPMATPSLPARGIELTLRSPSGWALAFGSRPPAAWLRELLAMEVEA
jgi:hypothetical protein